MRDVVPHPLQRQGRWRVHTGSGAPQKAQQSSGGLILRGCSISLRIASIGGLTVTGLIATMHWVTATEDP